MKKKYANNTFAILVGFLIAQGAFAAPRPGVASVDSAAVCDSSLWSHVYHSYRLVAHNSCMSVTGYVNAIYSEPDGDYHIRLLLDTQYNYMLNAVNISNEYSCLVCEPICAATITQTDAITPCRGLTNNVYLPNVGEYVKITGPYVTDNDHGWNEIHPVTSIVIVTSASVDAVSGENIGLNAYPNPASDFINFKLSAYPDAPVQIILTDAIGRSAGQYQMLNTLNLQVNTDWFPAGVYTYVMMQKGNLLKAGKFAVAH